MAKEKLKERKIGYHILEIQKGNFGEFSKIREEFDELVDAHKQDCKLMELQELSDLLGAIEGYIDEEYKGFITFDDLIHMKNLTKRAFKSGQRRSDIIDD